MDSSLVSTDGGANSSTKEVASPSTYFGYSLRPLKGKYLNEFERIIQVFLLGFGSSRVYLSSKAGRNIYFPLFVEWEWIRKGGLTDSSLSLIFRLHFLITSHPKYRENGPKNRVKRQFLNKGSLQEFKKDQIKNRIKLTFLHCY